MSSERISAIITRDGPTRWSDVPYSARPSAQERVFAAIAHLLTIFSLPGILIATVIWLTQRRRSRYVAMQARQAVLWQTTGHIVVFLAIALLVVTAILGLGESDASGLVGQVAGGSIVGSVMGLFLIPILATIFFFVSSIIGAIASLFGMRYTYPLVGKLAHRSVNPSADARSLPSQASNRQRY